MASSSDTPNLNKLRRAWVHYQNLWQIRIPQKRAVAHVWTTGIAGLRKK